MAIIKTLLLQDIALCRRIMVWTILVFGCIEVACAATGAPTGLKITPSTPVVAGTTFVKAPAGKETLTCAGSGGGGGSGNTDADTEYKFLLNGQVARQYEKLATYEILTASADTTKLGAYTCIAKNGNDEAADPSPSVTLTLDCNTGEDVCTTPDTHSECEGSKKYCKCGTPGGTFPKCNECANSGNCAETAKPRCDDTAPPNTCKACNASFCVATSAKPYCSTDNPGACLGCVKATNAGCTDKTKPFCKVSGQPCEACEVNPNNSGPDNGCNPASTTPRCAGPTGCAACTTATDKDAFCKRVDSEKPKCQDDGQCSDGSTAAPPTGASEGTTNKANTGDSNGTTGGKGSDTTSSAGTVTSTACLVIASVVVALMN